MGIKRIVIVLAVFLFVLNVADYVLTMWALDLGGTELNPIMAPIISTPLAPMLKIVGVGAVCLFAAVKARTVFSLSALATVTSIYVAIVSWNSLNLFLFYN